MKARAVVVDDERLSRRGIASRLERHGGIEVAAEFADGISALSALPDLQPDLLFLDVQMPGMDGLQIARSLPPQKLPYIIFVTAFETYAVDAFAVQAGDYLLKPICDKRFDQALMRFEKGRASRQQPPAPSRYLDRFAVRVGGAMQLVEAAFVDRITAYGDYARLHAGSRTYLIRETLQSLESSLDPAIFLRIHRSCIVQGSRIERWFNSTNRELSLVLRDGSEVKLSRSYRDRFDSWLKGR